MNPYQITYPTTVDPALLAEHNRGVKRARRAYYQHPNTTHPQPKTCRVCGIQFGDKSKTVCRPCRNARKAS